MQYLPNGPRYKVTLTKSELTPIAAEYFTNQQQK